ncbi:TPA: DUF551 domain-containing protein [Escherichia coli]|nr:DUF551 domain-containing protein [Escherichia coli]
MSAITKERVELFIKNPLDNGLTRGEQMELARIALASLEAEPVAWKATFTQIDHEYNTFTAMYSDKAEAERWVRLHKVGDFRADITPLYTAKPVPVVPGEIADDLMEKLPKSDAWANGFRGGWNACRAVMLQGSQPVSQTYKLHELSGNSPVTPDGWISCSDRMPEDTKMLLAFSQGEIVAAYWNWVVNPIDYKKYRAFTYLSGNILDDVTHWMPLPEPPQEAK